MMRAAAKTIPLCLAIMCVCALVFCMQAAYAAEDASAAARPQSSTATQDLETSPESTAPPSQTAAPRNAADSQADARKKAGSIDEAADQSVAAKTTTEKRQGSSSKTTAAEPADVADPMDATTTKNRPSDALSAMEDIETVDMFRLYNPNSGEHFYTGSVAERVHLVDVGWNFEGIAWIAPKTSKAPVFRLYNPNAGDHHYTLSQHERDSLIEVGWNDEGIGWYSDDSKSIAVLRQYNPNADTGTHNFTTSADEDESLAKAGWKREGIAWYAIEGGSDALVSSKIYLDAGHGMGSSTKDVYDSGALGNGYEEAKLTAELAKLTAQYAKSEYGLTIRTNVNANVPYWERQDDALERGCTSLVSLHFNASDGGGTGSESYIHSSHAASGAQQLQSIMHKALVRGMELRDRGKKEAALAVCSGKGTNLPGTLLEICFIDNSYDMKTYMKRKDTVARELAAGLYEAAKAGY